MQLVSGAPVPADRSHTELKPNGQQKDYVVLSPEERAKGRVKPLRNAYLHSCGCLTTMSMAIAETYARNPSFYGGTFCCGCRRHFPLNQFTWEPDGEPMDPALQEAWAAGAAARRKAQRDREIEYTRRKVRIAEEEVTALREKLAALEKESDG
jgi:hypothetical protein